MTTLQYQQTTSLQIHTKSINYCKKYPTFTNKKPQPQARHAEPDLPHDSTTPLTRSLRKNNPCHFLSQRESKNSRGGKLRPICRPNANLLYPTSTHGARMWSQLLRGNLNLWSSMVRFRQFSEYTARLEVQITNLCVQMTEACSPLSSQKKIFEQSKSDRPRQNLSQNHGGEKKSLPAIDDFCTERWKCWNSRGQRLMCER